MNIPARTLADDFRRSGKTQQDYCTKKNISIHTLRYYLYKKSRSKSTGVPKPRQPSPVKTTIPSFLSFNREAPPENTFRTPVTVIHGYFSIPEMVEVLSMATTRL
jgi:hypothetical protein